MGRDERGRGAVILKTVDGKPSGGSNPSLSANHFKMLGGAAVWQNYRSLSFCKHFANL